LFDFICKFYRGDGSTSSAMKDMACKNEML
jgi:hypothetical protein